MQGQLPLLQFLVQAPFRITALPLRPKKYEFFDWSFVKKGLWSVSEVPFPQEQQQLSPASLKARA